MDDIFNSQPPSKNLLDDDDNEDLFKSATSASTTNVIKKNETTDIFSDPLIEDINLNDDEDGKNASTITNVSTNNSYDQFTSPFMKSSLSANPLSEATSAPAATYPASINTTNIINSNVTSSNTSASLVANYGNTGATTQTSTTTSSDTSTGGGPSASTITNVFTGVNAAQNAAPTNGRYIEITVNEPHKCGDGMSSFILYKVTTRTNLRYFRKDLISVDRRFSDFLGLRDKLAEKHLPMGRIVPPAPEKDAYNTAKVKMTKDDNSADDFTEKRAAALQRFLNRIAAHPELLIDPDFREFLELDSILPRAKNTSALSSASVKRLLTRVGETMNKITFKMDETDPWFEDKQHQIDNLDQQLRKLHASVEALIHHRRELTTTTGQFAKSAAILGNCEEHTSLSCALSQLSETEEKLEQLYGKQASADFYFLAETIKDYINLIGVVKEIMHFRVKTYQNWQQCQQTLNKKRETKTRFEMTGRTDKLAQASEEVTEWENKVVRSQEEFEKISKNIKEEVEKFEIARIRDFKSNIVKYLESLLDTQQQIIKHWEAFLPEAKAIA